MAQQTFTLSPPNEFIPLDKLLKLLSMIGSGGEAHMVIEDGLVTVDGEVELRKRRKLRAGNVVEFNGHKIMIEG